MEFIQGGFTMLIIKPPFLFHPSTENNRKLTKKYGSAFFQKWRGRCWARDEGGGHCFAHHSHQG